MSVIQNVSNYLRRFFIGNPNKPNSIPNYPFSVGSLIPINPDIDSERAIELGYQKNSLVFSLVEKTAIKFGSISRYLYSDNQTAQTQKNTKHPRFTLKAAIAPYTTRADLSDKKIIALNNLLARPNNFQSQDAFFAEVISYRLVAGESFIWCNRGLSFDNSFSTYDQNGNSIDDMIIDRMPIIEMFCLPSNYISLIPDPEDAWNILGYVLNYGGYQTYLRKNDVIHWKNASLTFDPITRCHLRGVSALKSGGAILQMSTAAIQSLTRLTMNDGAKGLLVTSDSPDAIAPGQMDAVRSVIDRRINSHDLSGSVAVLSGSGWSYIPFGEAENLPLLSSLQYSDQQLCSLFQIPYECVSADATHSNKEQATLSWIRNTIIPLCQQLDGEMNRLLLKSYALEGSVCIASDFSRLPELQDNMLQQTQALAAAPFLTFNEKRVQLGYDPLDNPIYDQPFISQGNIPAESFFNDLNSITQTGISDDYPNTGADQNTNQNNNQ